MLKGELVNRNSREEPLCLKYSEGLVAVNVGALPPVLRGELVNENCHTPDPGPTRLANPNRFRGAKPYTGTFFFFFFFQS